MSSKNIPEIIKQISESLRQQSESIFKHKGDIGDSREKELIAFLEKVMPDRYGFSSGEIIDIENNRSHQTDIIIYDKLYSPYFTDGSGKIIAPVDSVYGMIEVKSKINTEALEQVKNQIETFNSLKRKKSDGFQINPYRTITSDGSITFNKSSNNPIFCLFGYESDLNATRIVEMIDKKNIGLHLTMINNKFLIITNNFNNRFTISVDSYKNIYTIVGDISISAFILILQLYLNDCSLVGMDISILLNNIIHAAQVGTFELKKII